MGDQATEIAHGITEGGIASSHDVDLDQDALVGPTTDKEFNTIKSAIVPIACWRVDDMRFEFDSSFVTPDIASELTHLTRLRKRLPGALMSVFAHADPVGDDVYNKTLSGRRAMSIYALLTRRVDMWEELFKNPVGNDKWGDASLVTMAGALALPPPPKPPLTPDEKASEFFEDEDRSGAACPIFAVDRANQAGEPVVAATAQTDPADRASKAKKDPAARKELFRAYMDRLCGPALLPGKEEFLGRGVDAGGKADFQGCSEFNPVLLFSKSEKQELSAPSKKEARDEENSPNRRVLIFFFRKGTRINPQLWPCPRAKEGTAACHKRFWSDADKRRSNQAERREYAKTTDTFACRFYDRLAHASPCETAPVPARIRLYDTKDEFIPNAVFRISLGSSVREGQASPKGFITVRHAAGAGEGVIEWGPPPGPGEKPSFPFHDAIFLEFPPDPDGMAARKLQNLGYGGSSVPPNERIRPFQTDYRERFGLEVTGVLDAKTLNAINSVHDGMDDRLKDR